MGSTMNWITGALTGGLSTGLNALTGGGSEDVINSFGSLGLSDLFQGNGFNPLDLGESAFKWTDDRMGTGSMNQDIGNIINMGALAYGGASAAGALGGLFGGSAVAGAEGAGAAGVGAAELGTAGATALTPLETYAALAPTLGEAATTAATTASPYAAMYSGGGAAGLMGLSTEAAAPAVAGLAETGMMGSAAAGGLGASGAAYGAAGAGSPGIMGTLGGIGKGAMSIGSGALNLAKEYPIATLLALNAGSQALSAKGQMESVDANRDYYQQTAYPNAAKVNAQSASAYANLASQIAQARRQAEEDYAKRGLGVGSLGGVYSKIGSAAQKSYAQLANDLIQYQNTPFYAPGAGTNYSNTATGTIANSANALTGTLGSLYLYQSLMGKQ